MKANKSNILRDDNAFSYIIPLTVAIVVGIALLVMGAFVVSEISSVLEETYPTNVASGGMDEEFWHNGTSSTYRNTTLTTTANLLTGSTTKFYIRAIGPHPIYVNLTVNGKAHLVNDTSLMTPWGISGYNHTLTALIASEHVANSDEYLNFSWNVNNTGSSIYIRIDGTYYVDSDFRSPNQNKTVNLLGNITDGFSDIVDIEIVVIIITALSMAIFTILVVGTRPRF